MGDSNTTLVKVKYNANWDALLSNKDSNTTLVKVKFLDIFHAVSVGEFKYNTC